MATNFEEAFAYLLASEEKFERQGGTHSSPKKWGISQELLSKTPLDKLSGYGIVDEFSTLKVEQAYAFYKGEYWDEFRFMYINNNDVGMYYFDMCIDMGMHPATLCLQRACWAVLGKPELLADDGVLTAKTLGLVNQCGFMIKAPLRAERGAYYRNIGNPLLLSAWYARTYG